MENEIKEIIRESIEAYINEDSIDRAIKNVVADKLDSNLKYFTDDYIKSKINESIDLVLKGEIDTNDGWGHKEHYESFEDMFKARFNKQLNDTWEIKSVIEKTVTERLDTLFKNTTKEITNKIQDMVLQEMLKEEK